MCMKKIIVLIFACVSFNGVMAQSFSAISVVKEFSQLLNEYTRTKNMGICGPKFDNLCHEKIKCRVENDLMKYMAEKSPSIPYTNNTYLFDTYINEIIKLINNGASVAIENVEYDYEVSKLGIVDGNADYIKYDIVLSQSLSTEKRFTDIAIVRDGKITLICQYAGARSYVAAIKTLFPDISKIDDIENECLQLDVSKAEMAFLQFRKIASNNYGTVAKKCIEMVIAMEMADVGCSNLGNYAKKIDKSTYFTFNTDYPNIEKMSSNHYELHGLRTFDYFVPGKGETTTNWFMYKEHPYYENKGSAYLYYISSHYRPIANYGLPYIKRKGDLFGFVSETGKVLIECKYTFAYPFDSRSGLAAVRDVNNKWGFIDEKGMLIIPHIYNIVNDAFVDGKNFVIKDDYLILITTKGEEVRRIYGYNYIIPKLSENEIIAYNGIKQQYDVFDFYGNLKIEDCFNHENDKGNKQRYRIYEIMWGDFTYNQKDDVNDGFFFLHRIPTKITSSEITSGDFIDLGIGTLWASMNLGAQSCADVGKPYLWGDYKCEFTNKERNAANGKKYKKKLLKQTFPSNIAGTYLDVVTQTLGKNWRMPTKEELRKLSEECIWEYCILNGCKGYRVTGKNGNSIFLPIEGHFAYKDSDANNGIRYWSSEMDSSQTIYTLRVTQNEHDIYGLGNLSYWNYIRPVKSK